MSDCSVKSRLCPRLGVKSKCYLCCLSKLTSTLLSLLLSNYFSQQGQHKSCLETSCDLFTPDLLYHITTAAQCYHDHVILIITRRTFRVLKQLDMATLRYILLRFLLMGIMPTNHERGRGTDTADTDTHRRNKYKYILSKNEIILKSMSVQFFK